MSDLSKGAAWMEGRVIPVHEAAIPVTDWGLIHSDVAYDVVPAWNGAFFRIDDYVARFRASAEAQRLDIGKSHDEIKAALHEMVAASGLRAAYVAMVVTRGRPADPANRAPRNCVNRFYAWCVPYVHVIKPDVVAAGAAVRVAKTVRRIPDESVDQRAKNYHWGDFTTGLMEAKDHGFETVVLLDPDGNVAEGPGFNMFAVVNGRIHTAERHVLHGITRRTVLEMAEALGIETVVGDLSLETLMAADEAFISTSGGGPLWIARIDDRVYNNAAQGPVAEKLHRTYWEWVENHPTLREPIAYASAAA